MTKFVYLAGPILGCNHGEANDWRQYVADKLKEHGIIGISPLRCEPLESETYEVIPGGDPKWHGPNAVGGKNFLDIDLCTMAFMVFPARAPGRELSAGTLIELGALKHAHKRVVVVSDDPFILAHSVVRYCAEWFMPTLDDGLDVVIGLLSGYNGGKNV